ncbi:hypothetical protein M9Y10_042031 [Tritrichomonas musculus]|uniref:Transmembrane protein n=1 Tax=Tritrichomonas musculus TaxID=1915356 RepID=A0ABR2K613_9EUKA
MLLLFILKIILTKTTKDSLDEQDIHYNNVNLQNHPKQKQINLTGACGPSLTYLIEGIGNGTTSPSYQSNVFDLSPIKVVYVMEHYESEEFCGLPVRLLSDLDFSMSEIITMSSIFTETETFTNLFELQTSNHYQTDSMHLSTEYFSISSIIENTILYTNHVKNSLTVTLTFVQMRSVSFSLSNSKSNTFFISFDANKNTISIIMTQSDFWFYFPYIIYYYSPKFVSTNIIINISKRKGITREQLIGIICGSSAVFFIILYTIIAIYRKMTYVNIENEISFSFSYSSEELYKKQFSNENQPDENKKQQKSEDDADVDFWL